MAEERKVLLQVDPRGAATVTLNRPDVHNAFDEEVIAGLHHVFEELRDNEDVRVVTLSARGKSFCAGADLEWMRRAAGFSHDENLEDARALAAMLRSIAGLPVPTIALVQGAALGGGAGVVAACDIAVAVRGAAFGFTEVRLGLIPATVSPFVVAAIGARQARRYFVTGERFPAETAHAIGLVHELVPSAGALQAQGEHLVNEILGAAPGAVAEAKALAGDLAGRRVDDKLMRDMAERIARRRASEEGREGVAAFLERRRPAWGG